MKTVVLNVDNVMRRKGIDRRQNMVEVLIERRKRTERRIFENRRSGIDRRKCQIEVTKNQRYYSKRRTYA